MDIPIVFITGNGNVENTVTALKAGAHDFIEKPFTRDVLSSMVSGPSVLSSKEVARELDISHRTVEHHRSLHRHSQP